MNLGTRVGLISALVLIFTYVSLSNLASDETRLASALLPDDSHSWHPVPFMLNSWLTKHEGVGSFDERACRYGSVGSIPATNAMLLAQSRAGKMTKFGP